jgi:DNA-binding transcriptional ArsR family regulator
MPRGWVAGIEPARTPPPGRSPDLLPGVELTGGTQANVSRHLQTLAHAHLLSRRKEGLQVFYAIADPTLVKLCELVCGSIDKQLQAQAGALRG